jgi:hypothetical protein
MTPASVGPGQTATFQFTLQAPILEQPQAYLEHLALYNTSTGRFGPADNEVRLSVTVAPPSDANIVVESRTPTGSNTPAPSYSEPAGALSATTSKSVIPAGQGPGLVGSGSRFGNTIGRKGRFQPNLPLPGLYNVYVTLGAGTNNNALTSWTITGGPAPVSGEIRLTFTDNTLVNRWKLLASNVPLPAGTGSAIEFTNLDGNDATGKRFVMDAVRFERVGSIPGTTTSQEGWLLQ